MTRFDQPFCWGRNQFGQVGDGTQDVPRLVPVHVHTHGLDFRQVSAGGIHSCGVTTDNRAFCWGPNFFGELGDGTKIRRLTPVAVVGRHRFRQVSAGRAHTCGVTLSDVAFCWGENFFGELGNGTTGIRLRPVRVVGPS